MHRLRFILSLLLVTVVFTTGILLSAQTSTAAPAASVSPTRTLTTDDIIKMVKGGVSDDVIIRQIRKNGQPFDLSPDQLIQLKSSAVSDRVVQAMLDPSKVDPSSTLAATGSAAKESATPSGLPADIGVYAKHQGQWVEILPEVVNWKTGGVIKSVATVGVVKGDVNGHLQGAHSRNGVSTPLEFLIVLPEGVAITEYQLLHLRQNGDNREFRTVTGGVFHVSGGATRDLISFEGKKVAGRQYSVSLASSLKAGEYGFLPPGAVTSKNAAASQGKLYSFRVLE